MDRLLLALVERTADEHRLLFSDQDAMLIVISRIQKRNDNGTGFAAALS
jgi:hypothetical protein